MSRAAMLQAHLAQFAQADFVWGQFDCCTFAADWVQSQCGFDPMQGLRGLDSALRVARCLRSIGGMRQAWSDRMQEPAEVLLARLGDLVLLPTSRQAARQVRGLDDALGWTMGICCGSYVAAPAVKGLVMLPLAARGMDGVFQSSGVAAWRV